MIKDLKNGKGVDALGIYFMRRICQKVSDEEEIPEEWCNSNTIPIFKYKKDTLNYENYRAVRLLKTEILVYEKIFESRLKQILLFDNCNFRFNEGKKTDAIFIIRQMKEKYQKKKLYRVFVDLEKTFHRVSR